MSFELPEIKRRIKSVIVRALELDIEPSEIDDEQSLFAPALNGGMELDSLAAVDIVVGMTNEFDVEFEEVPREAFGTVNALATFVTAALASKSTK